MTEIKDLVPWLHENKTRLDVVTDIVPDDTDDVAGMDLLVTEDRVRALVTKMVKDHTRSTVLKDYLARARALMKTARFHREEDDLEDIEEVPDDE
jgi:hypothetical protein